MEQTTAAAAEVEMEPDQGPAGGEQTTASEVEKLVSPKAEQVPIGQGQSFAGQGEKQTPTEVVEAIQ